MEPARHLALAAVCAAGAEDLDRARELVDRALEIAPADRSARLVEAAIAGDDEGVVTAGGPDPAADPDLLAIVAEAHVRGGGVDRAISIYRESLLRHAYLAGHRIRLAELLMSKAQLGLALNREADLAEARALAVTARDSRRDWQGPSADAVFVACTAAVIQRDMHGVLSLALPPPDGEALAQEAGDTRVRRLAAGAALSLGELDRVRGIVAVTTDVFESNVMEAELLRAEGATADVVQSRYEQAWASAPDDAAARFEVQMGLAHLGVWPIPGLEGLMAADEVQAHILQAAAEAAQGEFDAAVRRLRRYRSESEQAAMLLVDVCQRSDNTAGAVDALVEAAERFDNPRHLVGAAEILFRAGRGSEARALAEQALSLAGEAPGLRYSARRILAANAQREQDWPAMEASVRGLIADAGPEAELRWLLAVALFNQSRLEDAWNAVCSPSELMPANDQQALVWVQLHQRFRPTAEFVRQTLDLLEAFGETEQFYAAALIALYALDAEQVALDDDTVAELQAATQTFLGRFPESHFFFAVPIGQTAEEIVAAMRPFLEPGAAEFAQLQEQAARPVVPYGVLAAHVRRPYAAAFLQRAAGCFPVRLADPAAVEADVEVARAAVGHGVVTEASVLHLMSLVPDLWQTVLSIFSSIMIADASRRDLLVTVDSFAKLSTMNMGWDPQAGKAVLSEISTEMARDLRDRAQWMQRAADQLLEFRSSPTPGFEAAVDQLVRPWTAGLQYARLNSLPLYCDDAGLRVLARSEGVATFGTVALLRVMEETEELTDVQVEHFLLTLRRRFFVDLPPEPRVLLALADELDWRGGPSVLALSRPAFWSEASAPAELFGALCRGAADSDRAAVGLWVQAGVRGASAGKSPDVASQIASALIIVAASATGASPMELATIVASARLGLAGSGAPDPLIHTVSNIRQTLSAQLGPSGGASALLRLTSELEESDRTAIVRHVLGLDPGQ
jgi:tetratricopeptide (TPR) repeat protein